MTRRLILPEVADTVDPQLKYTLFGKLTDFQREEEPVVTAADDGRKLFDAGVSDKASNNPCLLFAAGIPGVLLLAAVVMAVFGGCNVKLENACICLEYIGDNGPCPVHGDPHGKKAGNS